MENLIETMMKLIGSEVCGGTLPLSFDSPLSDRFLSELYSISKIHEVAHLVGSGLINNGLLKGRTAENVYREQVYATVFRYEQQSYVLEKVCSVLEKSEIPYIPLKGAVIKNLYPQPWMRTSCDIDILVHEENLEAASKAITESLGYTQTGRGKHDVSILSVENVYVELHFSLLDEDSLPDVAKVLSRVWKHSATVGSGGYKFEMDDAMFYFYHIAHMAKHIKKGGCGIRPFLDLWLIENSCEFIAEKTKALLKEGRLLSFAEAARDLSLVWFSGKEHNKTTLLLEEYVLNGGIFGTRETRYLTERRQSGGRFRYLFSRIIIPYDDLKYQYPILKKHSFLTPICEICRLFSLLIGKKKNFRKSYLGEIKNVSEERINDINLLFERVGL